nr:MAG TPA: hypothetical protein [Caudoviricetes sp.]
MEFLTFILCILVNTLTVTVLLLSYRFNSFRDFIIDIIYQQAVIFQNLSKILC